MGRLRLVSWNVNGIRASYKKGFIDWLMADRPDILCLQETKAQPEQLPEDLRDVQGYHAYFASAERKGYSGVALYSRTEPLKVIPGFGDGVFDNEGRVIVADYPDFTIFGVYFPNGNASPERLAYKMAFYDAFLDHITACVRTGKNVVVCGDVNTAHTAIDLARPKQNEKVSGFLPEERAWIDRLIEAGFVDTFRQFTTEGGHYSWWDMKSGARARNVGWRLDYFFVNAAFADRVKKSYMLTDVMGSDHCPVCIEVAV